jgi:hypothetical protein
MNMKAEEDFVRQMFALLYQRGAPTDIGCDESLKDKMIALAETRHPNKNICVVKDWKWWDYDVNEDEYKSYRDAGFFPSLIFANYMVWDKCKRWPEGYNVKTSMLVTFEENCFFITRSTVYILLGPGQRKAVNPDAANAIGF